MVNAKIMIRVESDKYVVVQQRGSDEFPARNWKALQRTARSIVRNVQPNGNHSGLYECPDRLARKATF